MTGAERTFWWASEDDLQDTNKDTQAIVKALWDIANILEDINRTLRGVSK